MGWKIYLIAISNAANINAAEVPAKLGFDNLMPTREMSIHDAQYEQGLSIGKYDDKIYIVSSDLVFKFFDKTPSDFERKLTSAFPGSEIGIVVINETSSLYGYSIITNGQRQRVKSGADSELFIEFGNRLPEELEVSKENLFDDEVLKELQEDYSEVELKKLIDQEIGIRTTFRLTRRFFGKQFDDKDSHYRLVKVTKFE